MVNVIPAASRFRAATDWLESRWHFSFGHYNDPANVSFGPLRVFNDDVVQPASGFDTHPHRDAEIVSIVLSGQLEHRDSTGGHGVLNANDVQAITAGRGVQHSERNPSPTTPVHFLQLWFLPRTRGNTPGYDQRKFDVTATPGRLVPLVSGGTVPGTLTIDQDVVLYRGVMRAGDRVVHQAGVGRKTYVFVASGSANVAGRALSAGDQARIEQTGELAIETTGPADVVVIDLPA